MSTDMVPIRPGGEATNALTTHQQEDIGRLLVTEGDGSLAGRISRTDLMTALEITQTSQSTTATPRTIER